MASIIPMGDGWQAQVRRKGVRQFKTFATKTEAKRWATMIEAEIESGARTGKRSLGSDNVAQLIQEYIKHSIQHKEMGRTKVSVLSALQESTLGRVRLRELDAQKIAEYAEARHRDGAAPPTITIDLSYLGTVLKFGRTRLNLGLHNDLVQDARAMLRDHGIVGKAKERDRRPTEDELARLEKVWSSSLPFDLVRFAIASAMRQGEIVNLRWNDLRGSTILVRDRKDPKEKKGNDQWVPLSPEGLAIIQRQPHVGPLIFPYKSGTVSSIHPRMIRLAGIEDLRFHDYRHEGISRFFEAGLSIPEVATISGHKDWKQLRRYTQLKPDAIARKLAGL